jgi:uncharacterized protein (DUF1684 family)
MRHSFCALWILLMNGSLLINLGCDNKSNIDLSNIPPLEENYVEALLQERVHKDSALQYDPHSPFNRDSNAAFSSLNYYDPTPEFIFKSKLYKHDPIDTVNVFGTRGEIRRVIREGYVKLNYAENEYRVNVYKAFGRDGQAYHSIWFTDKTTGEETYGVGRYLDFNKVEDPEHIYTVDFNSAYNPYCAYSAQFTCPIPREEDHIAMEIKAGEKNFH